MNEWLRKYPTGRWPTCGECGCSLVETKADGDLCEHCKDTQPSEDAGEDAEPEAPLGEAEPAE